MMKILKIAAVVLISLSAFALDIYDEIANSIRSGDAKQVAAYFGGSIELTIIDKENVYSRAHGEMILKDFFTRHPPKSFTLLHKGSSREGTMYAIGNLVTVKGKVFRTSFYVKNEGGRNVLQELRIESE